MNTPRCPRPVSLLRLAALSALLITTACAGLQVDLPDTFLQLDTPRDELKATTPDGALLWVREFDDQHGGGLEFWTAALREDFVAGRGLISIGEPAQVEDDHGRAGTLQLFEAQRDGRSYGYLCALFVRDRGSHSQIRVAEFTAPRPRFDDLLPQVRAALATLRP